MALLNISALSFHCYPLKYNFLRRANIGVSVSSSWLYTCSTILMYRTVNCSKKSRSFTAFKAIGQSLDCKLNIVVRWPDYILASFKRGVDLIERGHGRPFHVLPATAKWKIVIPRVSGVVCLNLLYRFLSHVTGACFSAGRCP